MKNKQALTLVETLVAITLFSVLSVAAASLMLSSINMREGNQRSLKSENFIKRVFEKHKDFWSIKENYALTPNYSFTNEFLQEFPSDTNLAIEYSCLDSNGNKLQSDGSILNCVKDDPPLRRVVISISRNNNTIAVQKTDIGKPIASSGN